MFYCKFTKKHLINSAGVLLLLLFVFSNIQGQTSLIADSLIKQIEKAKDDTSRLSAYILLSERYMLEKETEKANEALQSAFDYAKNKELNPPYTLYQAQAKVFSRQGEFSEALKQMNAVLGLLADQKKEHILGEARNFMGWLYFRSGEFQKSILILQENISVAEKLNLARILPTSYEYLASIYHRLDETIEEREALEKMADVSLKENNLRLAGFAYSRLGDLFVNRDSNFVVAIKYYQKGLKYTKIEKDSVLISFALLRMAWAQYLNNQLQESLDNFSLSLEYSLPINHLTSITNAYGNIGTIYRDKKDYNQAIKNYKKSIEYSLKAHDWYNLSWLYDDMSQMYAQLDDYKLAYKNLQLHKQFSDSLERRNFSEGLAEARTRYETEKSKQELELVSLKFRQQKYIIYAFAGFILLGLIIAILIFRQIKISAQRRVSDMKRQVSEMTQKNLRQQMNPHFIFNTLNSIQYYMYQHDKISTNNYLTKFSSLMRTTLENSQHTSIPIQDELNALCLYLDLEAIRFKEKFTYSIDLDPEIDPMLMKIPTMLIQPYVENALVHGLMNKTDVGHITIELNLKKKHIECMIEDNGIGREAARNLKHQSSSHNSLGTKITESRLKLANNLNGHNMKIQFTDLTDENGKANGTRVKIDIPILI